MVNGRVDTLLNSSESIEHPERLLALTIISIERSPPILPWEFVDQSKTQLEGAVDRIRGQSTLPILDFVQSCRSVWTNGERRTVGTLPHVSL